MSKQTISCAFFALFLVFQGWAHNPDTAGATLREWHLSGHRHLHASFLLLKQDSVVLENAHGHLYTFALSALSAADRQYALERGKQIEALNRAYAPPAVPAKPRAHRPTISRTGELIGLAAVLYLLLLLFTLRAKKRPWSIALALFGVAILVGFKSKLDGRFFDTDPAFIDTAFQPFKPAVHTFWDNNWFYVESKGIPTTHSMMTGITKWQQQVPVPQCYIGNNSWQIPLHPVLAPTPVPVNPQHFIRGAVAIAANGVPIFNPFTNTGVDALVDGQLDQWGGHSGRADDYHYHIAPLHLDGQTPEVLPIAFALDGFAVYGSLEPDGSAMETLDANHGHFGADGVYHYHGTGSFPYMIGAMVGQVTEDSTLQIVPQAHANPIRPALTPLSGATITDFQPNGTGNGYILSYTKAGQLYQVDYSWTQNGQYTYNFISPSGTTTQVYNDFAPCQVPVATQDLSAVLGNILLFPNPAAEGVSLKILDLDGTTGIRYLALYDQAGRIVFQSEQQQVEYQLGHLPGGIYLVRIGLQQGELVRKLVIR